MELRTATILGCGISGCWVAHHLVSHGYNHFVLFGSSYDAQTLNKLGPFSSQQPALQTSALGLAAHLLSISPDLRIEIHGNFEPTQDRSFVKGDVVGAIGGRTGAHVAPLCRAGALAARSQGGKWITLALPSQEGAPILISDNPDDLSAEYLTGVPVSSRDDISQHAAEAARRLAEGN
jgi:hypothetical protein